MSTNISLSFSMKERFNGVNQKLSSDVSTSRVILIHPSLLPVTESRRILWPKVVKLTPVEQLPYSPKSKAIMKELRAIKTLMRPVLVHPVFEHGLHTKWPTIRK